MRLSHIHEDIQRKLRVGYDMDDVLADLDQVLRQEVSKKTGKYIAKPDRTEYYFEDIPALLDKLGMSKEELGPLVVKSFGNVFGHRKSDITAISGSINTIKELQKDGHSVIIITARDKKRSFDITNEWLKYMGIGDVKVYFAGTGPDRTAPKNSKAKVARLLKLDYFVDDSVENLGQFKKTGQDKLTKPIIFDQPWNSSYDGPRLTDHHSMMDLLNKLEN